MAGRDGGKAWHERKLVPGRRKNPEKYAIGPAEASEADGEPRLRGQRKLLRDPDLRTPVDSNQQANRRQTENQAGAAVADKRQWKSVVRQHRRRHRDILQRRSEEHTSELQ